MPFGLKGETGHCRPSAIPSVPVGTPNSTLLRVQETAWPCSLQGRGHTMLCGYLPGGHGLLAKGNELLQSVPWGLSLPWENCVFWGQKSKAPPGASGADEGLPKSVIQESPTSGAPTTSEAERARGQVHTGL